jgi:hypothetical protein
VSDDRQTPGAFHAPGGVVVHLFLPDYQPTGKRRAMPDRALCNAQAWDTVKAPLRWLDGLPPVLPEPLRWCAKCVGLGLEHAGALESAVRHLEPLFGESVDTGR